MIKKYLLVLPTVFCIMLGAAMPELASRMQDNQIDKLRKERELNTVSLTLRQETGTEAILRMLSQEYTEIYWDEETAMTAESACEAALKAMQEMGDYKLLPVQIVNRSAGEKGQAEPYLLIARDGNSILAWDCSWDIEGRYHCSITVDDATGILMRAVVSSASAKVSIASNGASTDVKIPSNGTLYENMINYEDAYMLMDAWIHFIQEYYGISFVDMTEMSYEITDSALPRSFELRFSSENGTEPYALKLYIYDGMLLFNYL